MFDVTINRVSKAPNYLRAFGLWQGPRLLFQVERSLHARSENVRAYHVPGYAAPIWLRDTVADHAIFWQIIVQREYRLDGFPHTARLLETYRSAVQAGKRPVIIDCGGNIGLSAIWFANRFPGADIYVLEPESANFALLSKNCAPYPNIHPIDGAIWHEAGYLKIENPEAASAAFRVTAVNAGTEGAIRAYTMDEIAAMAPTDEMLIVKLDIEGAQRHLFSCNTAWVGRTDLIALELDDWQFPWQGTSQAFFKCLSAYPFDYLIRGENIVCFRDRSRQAQAGVNG